jgi:hypothetical protein
MKFTHKKFDEFVPEFCHFLLNTVYPLFETLRCKFSKMIIKTKESMRIRDLCIHSIQFT